MSVARESPARTYVVQSRANSPASERRGSLAGDLMETTATATPPRSEDGRRNTNSMTGNNGNGNGEALQRVTRSQVRLHGVQLDKNNDEAAPMPIPPRKRKLRSAKTL